MNLMEIQQRFLDSVSPMLDKFKQKASHPLQFNFRCPYCGDSKKNPHKARGWLYEKDSQFFFHCFNCGEKTNFYGFLKETFPSDFKEYVKEVAFDKFANRNKKKTVEEVLEDDDPPIEVDLKQMTKISKLPHTHKAKKYIENRKIPPKHHYRIFFVKNFVAWLRQYLPNKLEKMQEHSRIVIPFFDKEGNIFGCTARSFSNQMRYLTFMFDEKQEKIFGLDTVDFSKKYYVTEGIFDSFFLDNSLAMVGADFDVSALENPDNAIVVFDNEPRNQEIVKRMRKYIDKGLTLCIWPANMKYKDINEMVLKGISDIHNIIDNNSYKGLMAELELVKWKR